MFKKSKHHERTLYIKEMNKYFKKFFFTREVFFVSLVSNLIVGFSMMYFLACLALVAVASAQTCNQACQMNYDPICGSNGMTYSNLCQLTTHNCVKRDSVTVQYAGECLATCNMACTFDYNPVCGTDAVTYSNKCELEAMSCVRKTAVAVAHTGECVFAQLVPVADEPCDMACQMNYEPVCGTDGGTYGNACQLKAFACSKNLNVLISHLGAC